VARQRSWLEDVRSTEWLGASFEHGIAKLRDMNPRVDDLLDEALALAPDERSALVVALPESLGGEDEATVTKAWAEEIRQRKRSS
jgi:hypothetical protein